jgi:SIR2-like protein
MPTLSPSPTKQEVLEFISRSASYGNLGGFIGAGFSKAVLNDGINEIALSWGQLLESCAKKLKVDYGAIAEVGAAYPEIASRLCAECSKAHGKPYAESVSQLKREVASLTTWYPDKKKREQFSNYLRWLSPSWVITTNYDLVIESLLTGRAMPLGPNDSLSSPQGVIPVYHLHGIRTNPEEIIITQEDYVSLFRPNEYRQIKLALTIRESTTLLLGYGLGDVNVLTALDWSNNVFKGGPATYPSGVIQILRADKPSGKPYRDKQGILILEADSLEQFFDEFIEIRKVAITKEKAEQKSLNELAQVLDNPDESIIDNFIDDEPFRGKLLSTLSQYPIHLISGFVSFIDKCIEQTWERSKPPGAFEGYNQDLVVLLDILTSFTVEKIPPALLQTTAYALDRVAYYVGDTYGKSWAAMKTWEKRKANLAPAMVAELNNIAEQHGYVGLKGLLEL